MISKMILALVVLTAASSYAEEMICRGGAGMTVTYSFLIRTAARPAPGPTATVVFNKGTQVAKEDGSFVGEGECSLTNRLISDKEPSQVVSVNEEVRVTAKNCGVVSDTCANEVAITGGWDQIIKFTNGIKKLSVHIEGDHWLAEKKPNEAL
jgi:hypothetical protein